ncbi:NAD(P)H-dependent glycerol-3-phosphate dehydrogenase [Sedimentibacter sp. zth1]|uniref:NAD(P)H-dependent glycerol-3-phosphate dehydrogenase n=1 Tax=Sedimentibacter sp. zth1 TaxID=2816908 RepID=UPI001A92A304|nr:NAD(P)H-dependent glycerol-3-phosphate dehydrogenase [Sedimentibacter sp. zth1]QSX06885.1 NAD(P)H-dependent glycerol-3-phosphate dehydrogenase [Sedimentibacter sp. zth1]
MKKIGVVGGGSWGTALAKVLCENGHEVKVWLRDKAQCEDVRKTKINKKYLPNVILPNDLYFSNDLDDVIKNSEIILNAIPTQKIREVLKKIPKEYMANKIVINSAKGIELNTHCLISEIMASECKDIKYCALSGPSHAEEVVLMLPTAITVACDDLEVAKIVQDLFMTTYLRVYTNKDVRGVELGGALKNIIALGAGISDGVGYGDNAKAALMTRGIVEITRLGESLGADIATFGGLSGIGDLIATCTSKHSRNRNAGYLIGQGYTKSEAIKKVGMVVEGITTTYAAYELAKQNSISMPIVEAMHSILECNEDVKKTVIKLMLRDKKDE